MPWTRSTPVRTGRLVSKRTARSARVRTRSTSSRGLPGWSGRPRRSQPPERLQLAGELREREGAKGIHRGASDSHFEVQVGAGRVAACADQPDAYSLADPHADADADARERRVH